MSVLCAPLQFTQHVSPVSKREHNCSNEHALSCNSQLKLQLHCTTFAHGL